MIYLALNLLLMSGLYIAAGVVALVRAAKAPSGRGLAFAGGAILVINGLIVAVWNIWYRVLAYPGLFDAGVALGPPPVSAPWVAPTYQIGFRVLLAIAIALLLAAVLSARGKQASAQGAPAPALGDPHGYGPQGYGPPSAGRPGHGFSGPQGTPQRQQQYPGPQQPQQAHPTGPQRPGGPQQPPQPHQRPAEPPQGGPSGPPQPPQG